MSIKIKHFTVPTYFEENQISKHYKQINQFLSEIDKEGHTFISIQTLTIPDSDEIKIITEVLYRENPTRKVITEKVK
jgi:hypothetical protein